MSKKGFTLVELCIVIVIIGILSTLGISQYAAMIERTLDDEAKANLILIRGADKTFYIENSTYYPPAGNTSDIAAINSNLGLFLSSAVNRKWNYQVWSNGCSRATRNGDDGRSWYFTIDDADNKPDAGAGCP